MAHLQLPIGGENMPTRGSNGESVRVRERQAGRQAVSERERNSKSTPGGWQIFDAYSINVNASQPNNKSTDRSNVAAKAEERSHHDRSLARCILMGQELFWSLFDTLFS